MNITKTRFNGLVLFAALYWNESTGKGKPSGLATAAILTVTFFRKLAI